MIKRVITILTTFEKKEDAENIANILLTERLASCIQIIPSMTSMYWWKNKIESTNEFLCLIKTRKSLYKKVEKKIKENHPYEVPEIIAINIFKGEKKYIEWIYNETKILK